MVAYMDINKKILIFVPLMVASAIVIHSQDKKTVEKKETLLAEIAARIGEYKNKTVTLKLKLKQVDRIFEKICFYDGKNHDIEFDVSSIDTKKLIISNMDDIHEGMVYLVTFKIRNVGKNNEVVADLLSFKPALLDSLPTGGNRTPR
jgi:hypothetical protein